MIGLVRASLLSASILIAAVAIVVVLLLTLDLGRFKPQVETLASTLAGRGVHIDGTFQPSLGSEIRLVVEDVRIDNPDWTTGDSLIKAQRLDVSLDTWALFSGQIILRNIEANEIAIALERDESGANNWTLFESDSDEAEDDSDSTLELLIRQVRVRDLNVTYVEPSRKAPLRFQASTIDQVQLDSGDLELELDGNINGTLVTLDATAGSFANLLAAGRVHYDLRGVIGEISINSKAQIDNLAEPRKPVGQLEISGPNAQYLTNVLGIAPITRGPLNLVVAIKPAADMMNLNIQGIFGEIEIDVVGSFSDLQDFDDANIEFSAEGADAGTFAELIGLEGLPADPYSIRGTVHGQGDTGAVGSVAVKIGDTVFNANANIAAFPDIDGAAVGLKIDGPEFGRFNKLLGLPGKLTGPFSLTADLSQSPQGEELVSITATARDIKIGVDGVVSMAPDFVGTKLAWRAQGDDLSVIAGALDIANVAAVPFAINANLSRAERGFAIDKGVVKLGADVIRVDGLVGIEPLQRDTDLRFQASGPGLAGTLGIVGLHFESLPPGDYELAGEIQLGEGYFELEQITARLGSTRARLSGRLGNPPKFQGTNIDITIEGDSLAELVPADSGLAFQAAPFSVDSTLELTRDALNISQLKVHIGTGELRGEVSIGMSPMLASGSAKITANGPNVAEWAPAFGAYAPVNTPFDLALGARWQESHVMVDQLSLKLGKGRLDANGTVDGADFARTNLYLDASFASLSSLGQIAGTELPDHPLTFSAHLIGSENRLQLENLRANSAKSNLSGRAIYERRGEVPFVDVNLASTYLNLVPLLPPTEEGAAPKAAQPAGNGRVIPDTPMPMDVLQQLNARVDISISELVLPETTVNDVVLTGSLQDGALRIEKFGVAGQRGTLAGTLELLPTAADPRMTAAIDGSRLTLGLTPISPDALDQLPHYDFQLKMAADGATVRDMAASLDANLRLVAGSGQVKSMPGWFARDFVEEIVDTVNPLSKQESSSRVECVALLLRTLDGQLDGRPALVLQTDKLNIIGVAFIDLGTERIDIKFETEARTGIGVGVSDFVTPFTKVSGTLANPQLSVDSEQVVTRGGVAALTMGASFIAKKFKSRFFSTKDPCGKSVAKADAEIKALNGD